MTKAKHPVRKIAPWLVILDVHYLWKVIFPIELLHQKSTSWFNLCNTCVDANVPFDVDDKIVGIIHDSQNNGLNIDDNIFQSRQYFLSIWANVSKFHCQKRPKWLYKIHLVMTKSLKSLGTIFIASHKLIHDHELGELKTILLEVLTWKSCLTHLNIYTKVFLTKYL